MKNNSNASAQAKVSAKEMMDLVVGIDQKVSSLIERDTKEVEEKKPNSKTGVTIAVMLMVLGAVILAFMFVPQLKGFVPVLAGQWQWVSLGYATIAVIAVSCFNVKTPVRIITVLLAIAPIAANLIIFAL